ncbi:NfeD family protein [Treponema sp.]|uniref:NfeD family protein n=1 Tax=Treponema sp. TaxID=166 RepID=UPI0025F4AD5C|nr:NfeD family protein [Treponema sp.]MCR5217650.1 NfeD family protein [Treponema sp.]
MIQYLISHLYWFWLAIVVISTVIEALTFALTTIWAALAALLMVFISFTPIPFVWQLIIFLIITIALILFTRPFAIKKLKVGKEVTNVAAIVGQEVIVVDEISKFKKGSVKSSGGILWTAALENPDDQLIASSQICTVISVEGNTVKVAIKK